MALKINYRLGDILEKGSNANGEYIKFTNGLMICTKIVSGTSPTPGGLSTGLNYTSISTSNWAVPFVELYSAQVTSNNPQFWAMLETATNITPNRIRLIRWDANAQPYNIHLFAIGTWK